MRGNGGGIEGLANRLYSHLSRDNFQALEYVRTDAHRRVLDNGVDPPVKVKPFQTGGLLEKWLMQRKGEDGKFYRKDLNWGLYLKAYNKSPEHVYNGEVYVLMDGASYSTTNYFIRLMYKAQRATFIGEEPGGQYHDGLTQAWLGTALPHSGVRLAFPLFAEKFNDDAPEIPYGRGVPPDHSVPTTLGDFIEDRDSQLEYTLNLIRIYIVAALL